MRVFVRKYRIVLGIAMLFLVLLCARYIQHDITTEKRELVKQAQYHNIYLANLEEMLFQGMAFIVNYPVEGSDSDHQQKVIETFEDRYNQQRLMVELVNYRSDFLDGQSYIDPLNTIIEDVESMMNTIGSPILPSTDENLKSMTKQFHLLKELYKEVSATRKSYFAIDRSRWIESDILKKSMVKQIEIIESKNWHYKWDYSHLPTPQLNPPRPGMEKIKVDTDYETAQTIALEYFRLFDDKVTLDQFDPMSGGGGRELGDISIPNYVFSYNNLVINISGTGDIISVYDSKVVNSSSTTTIVGNEVYHAIELSNQYLSTIGVEGYEEFSYEMTSERIDMIFWRPNMDKYYNNYDTYRFSYRLDDKMNQIGVAYPQTIELQLLDDSNYDESLTNELACLRKITGSYEVHGSTIRNNEIVDDKMTYAWWFKIEKEGQQFSYVVDALTTDIIRVEIIED